MKKNNIQKICMTFIVLFFSFSVATAGLGVSVENQETPTGADIFFPKILRGGYAEKIIHISSNNPDTTIVDLKVNGDIKEWVKFEPGIEIEVPQNTDVQIKMILQPPADTANGIYKGTVMVQAKSPVEAESGYVMGVTTAVSLKIEVEITGDQVYSFQVEDIKIWDSEEGIPAKLSVKVKNDGNVQANPNVHAELWSWDETEIIKEFDFKDTLILPSKTEDIILILATEDLNMNQYWIKVFVFNEDTLVKEDRFTFDILEKGALRIKGELLNIKNEVWAKVGEIIKITSVFENKGELITTAKFKGEVYLEEKLIEVLESDPLTVLPGDSSNLVTYFTPDNPGRYLIKGLVTYSDKITETKESILNVNSGEPAVPLSTTSLGIFGLMSIAAVVVVGFFVNRKFRKKEDL